ncbi:ATP-binding protein [Leuconostoc citreum]|uniref:ATP-binding protein n=2 Tax=Leuconostoc TaxID=1243 RepID=UPI0002D745A9|nr:ATP-binding protein [Leuconostoc citreum]
MKNDEWKIGIVDSVGEGIVTFVSNYTDIGHRINKGVLLSMNGVNDFVYTKLDVSTYILMRIFKIKNGTEDTLKMPNSFISVNKVTFFAEPLGILTNGKFISGAMQFPMVGKFVFGVTDQILSMFFSSVGDNLVSLGKVNNYPSVSPDLNLQKILTSHIAIVGNTGSGKSTTLRVLIDRIHGVQNRLNSLFKMFIFDVHGDYSEVEFTKKIIIHDMHLVLKNLSIDDWSAALLPSEKTQKPILSRALSIARVSAENKKILYAFLTKIALQSASQDGFALMKRTVSKWCILALPNEKKLLDKWTLDYGVETDASKQIEYKIDAILEKISFNSINELVLHENHNDFSLDDLEEAFDIVFGEEEVQGNRRSRTNTETMMARFRNLKNHYGGNDGILNKNHGDEITLRKNDVQWQREKFFIVDLTQLDDVALRLVSNYLVRSVFLSNLNFDRKKRDEMPFNYLYLDEAHRYVQNSPEGESNIFDVVAREGRKFNVYMGVISQIPSELSKTVMSQIGAYFIHRIQNSTDLEYIKKNVPGATNNMISRLPALPAGTALLSGTAFDVPFEINIDAGLYGDASSSLSPILDE